jgi:hypothetical protein
MKQPGLLREAGLIGGCLLVLVLLWLLTLLWPALRRSSRE